MSRETSEHAEKDAARLAHALREMLRRSYRECDCGALAQDGQRCLAHEALHIYEQHCKVRKSRHQDEKDLEKLFKNAIGRCISVYLSGATLCGVIVEASCKAPLPFVRIECDGGNTEMLYLDHALALARDGVLDLRS